MAFAIDQSSHLRYPHIALHALSDCAENPVLGGEGGGGGAFWMQHALLHATLNLVFGLRMSSPDDTVENQDGQQGLFQQSREHHCSQLQQSHEPRH